MRLIQIQLYPAYRIALILCPICCRLVPGLAVARLQRLVMAALGSKLNEFLSRTSAHNIHSGPAVVIPLTDHAIACFAGIDKVHLVVVRDDARFFTGLERVDLLLGLKMMLLLV